VQNAGYETARLIDLWEQRRQTFSRDPQGRNSTKNILKNVPIQYWQVLMPIGLEDQMQTTLVSIN
jgi:hypothetical protein